MRSASFVLLAGLFISSPALAWKPINQGTGSAGWIWSTDNFPITFYVTEYVEDSLPSARDGEGLLYQERGVIDSFDGWLDAPCAKLEFAYGGQLPGNEGPNADGLIKIYYDDPSNLAGTSVNAFALGVSISNNTLKEVQGTRLNAAIDVDIVFNDGVDWATSEDIDAGNCNGEMSLESTGTHEVGHLLGLGHSCEDGEACLDPALASATMFWQGGPCDTSRAAIGDDDVSGITALYGPYAYFTTESVRSGSAPLTLDFEVFASEGATVSDAQWTFGDGGTSTEIAPSYTYEEQGQFSVDVVLGGTDDDCGEWSFSYREPGFVLVCEVPDPVFSVEPVVSDDGVIYQMVNETDLKTIGCVDEVSWEVLKAGQVVDTCAARNAGQCPTISAWSPKIIFPEEGDYTVRLTTGGPAGSAQAELQIAAEPAGCATSGAAAAGLAGVLVSAGALLRRRR